MSAVKGDVTRKDDMRAQMRKADFESVRGPYVTATTTIPIQNFYLQEVVKDGNGMLTLKTVATIVENDQDDFAAKCPMKW